MELQREGTYRLAHPACPKASIDTVNTSIPSKHLLNIEFKVIQSVSPRLLDLCSV